MEILATHTLLSCPAAPPPATVGGGSLLGRKLFKPAGVSVLLPRTLLDLRRCPPVCVWGGGGYVKSKFMV